MCFGWLFNASRNLGFEDDYDYDYAELGGMEPVIADAGDIAIIERLRKDVPDMGEICGAAAKK